MAPALAYTCRALTCLQAEVFSYIFFAFHVALSNILLQSNSYEEKIWRDVTSGMAAMSERHRLAPPKRTGGRHYSEWDWRLSVLRSGSCCLLAGAAARAGSPSADWTSTQCRLDRSDSAKHPEAAAWMGLWRHPRWQDNTAPPAPLASWTQPRASSGSRFLCLTGPCAWAENSWHHSVEMLINHFCSNLWKMPWFHLSVCHCSSSSEGRNSWILTHSELLNELYHIFKCFILPPYESIRERVLFIRTNSTSTDGKRIYLKANDSALCRIISYTCTAPPRW